MFRRIDTIPLRTPRLLGHSSGPATSQVKTLNFSSLSRAWHMASTWEYREVDPSTSTIVKMIHARKAGS